MKNNKIALIFIIIISTVLYILSTFIFTYFFLPLQQSENYCLSYKLEGNENQYTWESTEWYECNSFSTEFEEYIFEHNNNNILYKLLIIGVLLFITIKCIIYLNHKYFHEEEEEWAWMGFFFISYIIILFLYPLDPSDTYISKYVEYIYI